MKSSKDLISKDEVHRLAKPAQITHGKELADAGAVEFLEFTPTKVTAKVKAQSKNSQDRTTKLWVKNNKLAWHCTCTSDQKSFCRHLVATSIALARKS
jgi:uncharacterized Zn finger protein